MMQERFPFFPHQSVYDSQAACAVSMAITAMGPAFQIVRQGFDEMGFFVDGCCSNQIEPLWLEEVSRKALRIWQMNWELPESMLASNLREFWRYNGQRLRARQPLFTPSSTLSSDQPLLDSAVANVLSIDGQREIAPAFWTPQRDAIEGFAWDIPTQGVWSNKGHEERSWRLSGRVMIDRSAKKAIQKAPSRKMNFNQPLAFDNEKTPSSKKKSKAALAPSAIAAASTEALSLSSTASIDLTFKELKQLWEMEQLWREQLIDLSSALPTVSCFGWRGPHLPNSDGWWWGVRQNLTPLRHERLLNENQTTALHYRAQGSRDELEPLLSSFLRRIEKVVKILGLEVEQRLLSPATFDLSALTEELEQIWSKTLHKWSSSNGDLYWDLWGYHASGTWWPLARCRMIQQGRERWELRGEAVISFERWLALHNKSS